MADPMIHKRRVTAKAADRSPLVERALLPLEDYIAPGRRRTDNPLVVGTVILCLGITAMTGIVQLTATYWAGSQLRDMLEKQEIRDKGVDSARAKLYKNAEAQSLVLRRLCLNTARDERDRGECLTIAPPLSTEPSLPSKEKH